MHGHGRRLSSDAPGSVDGEQDWVIVLGAGGSRLKRAVPAEKEDRWAEPRRP
jgi:hypothetical protein